ncbi:MAG: class B sortase, partial [Lachnospiraceae bacterium]|nr:class B sortase [Lachnospiraceae bacterium]
MERVELAPLVFVPAFIITIYIVAFFASLIHVPARAKTENKPAPTGIKVNNTVAQDMDSELEDDFVYDLKGLEDMLPEMREWYQKNEDCVGWLKVDDMKIDYPIVQRKDDGLFYVTRNFEGNDDDKGSIVLDADDEIGTGLKSRDYQDGTKPSTNLIIGGHNMRNGTMFGDLDKFRDKSFTASHNIIKLNSLYEEREYEIVSVFL